MARSTAPPPDAAPAPAWTAAFLALAIGAGAVETWLLQALVAGAPPAWVLAAVHAALVAVLAGFALVTSRHRARPWTWLLAGATALTGPVGAFGATLGLLLHRRFARESRPFEDWYQELFPERHRDLADRLYEELAGSLDREIGGAQVVPFVDVISHGSRTQKQLAIGLMSRHYQPSFAPALRSALADPDNSVRIQAATAIANIENRFLEAAMRLEESAESSPSAPTLLDLARHYDRYAFTGLLDEDRERRNRTLAIESYRRYLGFVPDDAEARVAVGRLMMRQGDAGAAAEWLEDTRARLGPSPRLDSWLMEALFELRRYADVRRVAGELRTLHGSGETGLPPVFEDTARLWGGESAA